VGIRPVESSDIAAIASIFISAFPESIEHYYRGKPAPAKPFRDIYSFLAAAEHSNFLVYEESGEVLGYIVVPRNMGLVWIKSILTGHLILWAFNWVSGQYGLSLPRVITILGNKLVFAAHSLGQFARGHAQVLSVAVAPKAQGRGVGRKLVQAGLDLLRSQGVSRVKLEVRPENAPARRIYSRLGFGEVGVSYDSQGKWVVMTTHLDGQESSQF
jgi:ribosomal-protein-alanine N-acetyltransferase